MDTIAGGAFDAIVVGSGPGGATVARDLSRLGRKVLILEWGPGGPIRGNLAQYVKELMVPGKSLLVTNRGLGLVRGITTGGSSVFYYGTCFPVPLEMFSSRGVDLAADVEQLRSELPIAPLKDEMFTPMAARIMDSARRLDFNWQRLEKFMYQDRWKPEYMFGYYGDPNGVKWSARMYADEAVANGAVLVDKARVTRVIVENGTATGVEYEVKGQKKTASAPVVVVSAGGIGSPLILRNSGIKEAGYDFFFDPLITICGTIKDVALRQNEIPMSAGVLMKNEGYIMTDMPVTPANHLVFTGQVLRLDKLFAFRHTARIMVKIKDEQGGRLTDRGGVRKKLSGADMDKLLHGYANARRILREAGATGIYKSWYLAAHPGGTVKLGQLVDANLQTQYRNLYVCDCSVVPEAWGLPPVLTVLALGKRLARHLTAQEAGVSEVEEAIPRAAVA